MSSIFMVGWAKFKGEWAERGISKKEIFFETEK